LVVGAHHLPPPLLCFFWGPGLGDGLGSVVYLLNGFGWGCLGVVFFWVLGVPYKGGAAPRFETFSERDPFYWGAVGSGV